MSERFKTADVVRVRSLDEEWQVAMCQGGWVTCCGWPETMVPVDDCDLVTASTPDEEHDLLVRMSPIDGPRGAYARRTLEARREAAPKEPT